MKKITFKTICLKIGKEFGVLSLLEYQTKYPNKGNQ